MYLSLVTDEHYLCFFPHPSPSPSLSLTHCLSLSLTLSPSPSHSLSLPLSLPLTLSLSLPPSLSLSLHVSPPLSFSLSQGPNELSEQLLRDLNADGKIHLVPSKMKDVFFLRLAICAPDSQTSDVKHAWEVIQKAADAVLTSHKA